MPEVPLSIALVQAAGTGPSELAERIRALGHRVAAQAADLATAAAMLGTDRPDLAVLCLPGDPAAAALAARECWQAPILLIRTAAGQDDLEDRIDAVIACVGPEASRGELAAALDRAAELRASGNHLARVIW